MDAVYQLKRALQTVNQSALKNLCFDQTAIEQEVDKLQLWLSNVDQGRSPISTLIRQAIWDFQSSGQLTFRNARLVCYGVAMPLDDKQHCFFEEGDQFEKLLTHIDGYRNQSRKYRRCYRGLLLSYFNSDPEILHVKESGFIAWNRLRDYLSDRMDCINTEGVTPYWVAALQAHRNLLTVDPCSRYAQELLNGIDIVFEDMEQRLGFSGTSWVSKTAMQACITAVLELPDAQFKNHVSGLLKLLGRRCSTFSLDQALAKLLDRYCRIQPHIFHRELLSFAIEHWKNPWFDTDLRCWSLVSETVRKMVEDWFKCDLINGFFECLAVEGDDGSRRRKFWNRYIGQMTEMYLILGYYAMYHQSSSFADLRRKAADRLLRLSDTGRESNALVMVMGNYVLIELGASGGVVYIHQELPFKPNQSREITLNTLISKDHCLMHRDRANGYERWEQYFDAYLYQNFRIRASSDELPEPWRSGLCLTVLNANTLTTFCRAFGLRISDDRNKGGHFWVLADGKNSMLCEQLRAWGFVYRVGKGWFWDQLNGGGV